MWDVFISDRQRCTRSRLEICGRYYMEYKKKDIVVAEANTNVFPRYLDSVTQLQVNLKARRC